MIDRLMKMFQSPGEYWNLAIAEPGDIQSLLMPQMAVLAAIPAVAQFVGTTFSRISAFGFGRAVFGGLLFLVLGYAVNLAVWIGLGYIIDALAKSFDAQQDLGQSMKLAAGAVIPSWLGSVLFLVPFGFLGMIGMIAGMGYGGYLLYLGLPIMNSTPQEKAMVYAIASIAILLVISFIVFPTISCLIGSCLFTSGVVVRSF